MGGGTSGNFGKTKGSTLDALSDLLAAASLIPGVDSITDLLSIPVDLARGDFLSAGLDAIGILPLVGEVADTAKLAKIADKAIDTAKAVDKTSDVVKSAKKAAKITSVTDNAKSVAKKYNLSKSGYFGTKGKNTRVFKSNDPIKSSADFYKKISKGGRERVLPNGKGVQTTFSDNSSVIYRVVTKTPNSPTVEITVETFDKIKPQKIHFIK